MYKPSATNHADALTRWEQDLDNQIAKKIALWTQMFLGPECLDPQIQAELDKDLLNAELCSINKSGLDFIDELLQANHTATSLQEYHEEAKDGKGKWTLENGLLKHQEWLVVTSALPASSPTSLTSHLTNLAYQPLHQPRLPATSPTTLPTSLPTSFTNLFH